MLYNICYHHTCRWRSLVQVERGRDGHYVLVIRRSKLYYTTSAIITPVGGGPVYRLREDGTATMCSLSGGQNCIIHLLSSHL